MPPVHQVNDHWSAWDAPTAFPEGTQIYTIADLTRVWVLAGVYEYELPWLEVVEAQAVVQHHLAACRLPDVVSPPDDARSVDFEHEPLGQRDAGTREGRQAEQFGVHLIGQIEKHRRRVGGERSCCLD